MKHVVWILVVLLLVLHQDNWLWDNSTLLFGFMPITLLFHAGISVAAAIVWYLATLYCWPPEIENESPTDDTAVNTVGDGKR